MFFGKVKDYLFLLNLHSLLLLLPPFLKQAKLEYWKD
jgi:hypothetical protein